MSGSASRSTILGLVMPVWHRSIGCPWTASRSTRASSTIVKSEQTAAIVNTIAGLGHNLDVPITAEGVESEQIRNALAGFGCSEAQGWLFGRAISGEAVRAFLNIGTGKNPPEAEQPTAIPSQDKRKAN